MPLPPAFLDRRPALPDVSDDVLVGIVPQERRMVDVVDPKQVRALISEGLGGGKRQYGIADAVLALFGEKRWHVIREG
jgi:hypothetical protein